MPERFEIHSEPDQLLRVFFATRTYSQVAILTDANTATVCYPDLKSALPPHQLIQVQPGEEAKNLETCAIIWQHLTDQQLDRHSLVLVLGGGVLGDMGGFCAATYKRGIDFVLMPTTLLAQVDASIGGKLGIDFNHFKNHIGVFQTPVTTLISPAFLKTLPERELRSGFAEIIKHCLISDAQMWDAIRTKSLAQQDWNELIPHSVSFKTRVIDKDPREKGLRKILNFGHSIGHALESYFLDTDHRLFHGEAIAIGMIVEAWLSFKKGFLSEQENEAITAYFLQIFGKTSIDYSEVEEL
ncbi:MAG: 3-dehydroquinate synthase, partial [Verrucomicrobia bacterium]|nr:3-dehydroquinate synthase [Cytophagales bacterium]